eukprot:TRINITY_DN2072_c0_g2_i1.p1 TRINITY_DN2072_c0_g2~~TRINITY_DN2072_c0_g2_i1.p1  ORF type:complete len:878 (-),score=121.04 TRINITY_DN2072_c0_g2_i1:111-2744(-)
MVSFYVARPGRERELWWSAEDFAELELQTPFPEDGSVAPTCSDASQVSLPQSKDVVRGNATARAGNHCIPGFVDVTVNDRSGRQSVGNVRQHGVDGACVGAMTGQLQTPQCFTHYGRSVRRAALRGVDAEMQANSATSQHSRLNRALDAAKTIEQLLEVISENFDSFGIFQCIFAFHRLARIGRLASAPLIVRHSKWVALVERVSAAVVDGSMEPRQLSSIAWACANLRVPDKQLVDSIADQCISGQPELWDPMSLSLVPQSFALLHARNGDLLTRVSAQVRRETSTTWTPGDVSRVVWSWAKLMQRDDALFRDASCKLISRLDECTPLILAQSVWAFATAGPADTASSHFYPRAAAAMQEHGLAEHSPAHLAMVVWSFAAVLYRPVELLQEIGTVLPDKVDRLNAQDISMTVWSYAALLAPQRAVFEFLASVATVTVRDFNPQDLANTAWAFATAGEYSPPLMDAIGNEACRRPDDFNSQHISMLVWSFVTVRHRHDRVFSILGQRAQVDRNSWSSSKLLAYTLAGLPRLHAEIVDRQGTLKLAASLLDAWLERSRTGFGQADDAHTVHDALYPFLDPAGGGRELSDPAAWACVDEMMRTQRRRVASLADMRCFEDVVVGAGVEVQTYNLAVVREYQATVQSFGLRGLGSAHTWELFQSIGLQRAGKDFGRLATEALQRPEPTRPGQEPGRGERANRCFWRAKVFAPGPDGAWRTAEEPGRTQNSTVVGYREETAGLVAVKLSHDRVSHRAWDCEFRAMARTAAAGRALLSGLSELQVRSLLDVGALDETREEASAVNCGEDEAATAAAAAADDRLWHDEGAIEGSLCIYMTEVPCISCVCAMLQFRRRFPRIVVEVEWNGLLDGSALSRICGGCR